MSIKKILFVIPNDRLGGAEQVLKMIASYYKAHEVHIYFLCKKTNGREWDANMHKLHYSQHNNRLFAIFSLISFLFSKGNRAWDYIFSSHINVTGVLGILLRLQLFKKKQFIARESTTAFQRFRGLKLLQYRLMYKLGYTSVDLLVCQTDDMKTKLIASMPALVNKTKIVTIPNPVNFSKISKSQETINQNDYIVSAGRFMEAKAYDVLIDAFYKFNKEYPGYKLIILGDGELKPIIKDQCIALGLKDKVLMPGRVNNVMAYFKSAALCVVSSRVEGFPNVLLQMMSQNTKVVSTLCAGGISKIEGVIKVEIEDSQGLADAMIDSLTIDTINNRHLFDKELESRDICNFMKTLDHNLQ